MQLKNKEDGKTYLVSTMDDDREGFAIFALCISDHQTDNFCMHYKTLAEFCEEWEDID